MSAEYAAEKLLDAVAESIAIDALDDEVTQDMRSGGYFFDFTAKGRTYQVLVQEVQ
jgi:hypothetical protein